MLPNYRSGNLKPSGSEHPTKSHRVFDIKRLGSDPNSGGAHVEHETGQTKKCTTRVQQVQLR